MFNVEVLADSLSPQRDRLTTMKITYPRIIHSEMMTHRMFSRNSASSRAIPFKKMVQMVKENPFIPLGWQKHHSGMQGSEYFSSGNGDNVHKLTEGWLKGRDSAVQIAEGLHNSGVTKQLCNRLLEPFMWHTALVTATEWNNFFELRCPKYYYEPENKYFKSKKDYSNYWFECFGSGIEEAIEGDPVLWWLNINHSQAEIHIQALAESMWDAYNESTPKELQAGEWHIPFEDKLDTELSKWEFLPNIHELWGKDMSLYLVKVSTAMAARTSYTVVGDEKKIDYQKMIELHDRLIEMRHYSPLEHCARAMSDEEYFTFRKGDITLTKAPMGTSFYLDNDYTSGWCRNFRGFIQYRHLIDN